MLKNAAKANFTIEELGWRLQPIGNRSMGRLIPSL
jgi:hypothetical protein